jgi:hypothetical protein
MRLKPAFPDLSSGRIGLRLSAYSCGGSRGINGKTVSPHSLQGPCGHHRLYDYRRIRGGGNRHCDALPPLATHEASLIDTGQRAGVVETIRSFSGNGRAKRECGAGKNFAQCRGCPRNCRRRAILPTGRQGRTPLERSGKAGRWRRPASQENCRLKIPAAGRGAPDSVFVAEGFALLRRTPIL